LKAEYLVVFCLVLSLPVSAIGEGSNSIAGSVKKVTGSAVVRRGGGLIPIKEGLHVLPHDVLETAAGASMGIILQDGTRVSMGPNTTLEIDTYLYSPGDGKLESLLRLVRGVMVYVSGKMAKLSPGSVKVETPVGVVGMRGTEFAVSLDAH
jgi:hypothetical protein